jgi:hypothetical protein
VNALLANIVAFRRETQRAPTLEEVRELADFLHPGPIRRLCEAVSLASDPGAFVSALDTPDGKLLRHSLALIAGRVAANDGAYKAATTLRRIADALLTRSA